MLIEIEVVLSTHPLLVVSHVPDGKQILLHHSRDFEQSLVLVHSGHMHVAVEVRVVVALVFHGATESHSQALHAAHRHQQGCDI